MDSVRALWSDVRHNVAFQDLARAFQHDAYWGFGLAMRFYLAVAQHHRDGILFPAYVGEDTAAQRVAQLAGWPGRDALALFNAMYHAGILCFPLQEPQHHGSCGLRLPRLKGAPEPDHATGFLAVHEWDRRVGPHYRRGIEASIRRRKHRAHNRAQRRLPLGRSFSARRAPPGGSSVGATRPGDPPVVSPYSSVYETAGIAGSPAPFEAGSPGQVSGDPAIHPPAEPETGPDSGGLRTGPGDPPPPVPNLTRRSTPPPPSLSPPRGSPGRNRLFPPEPCPTEEGDKSPSASSAPSSASSPGHNGHGQDRPRTNGHCHSGRGSGPLEGRGDGPVPVSAIVDPANVVAFLESVGPKSRLAWLTGLKAFIADGKAKKGQREAEARAEWERRHGPEPRE